jgi:hydroxymethylglutaryl-CoA lyase
MQKKIEIWEVGPRDGLQNELEILETSAKIELIAKLLKAGLKHIEITSFVNPKLVPQFYDAEDVMKHFSTGDPQSVTLSSLVPNVTGANRALESGAKALSVFMSASEAHNQANVNMSIDDSLAQLKTVSQSVRNRIDLFRGYIVTTFGCPYQGEVPIESVLNVCRAYLDMGIQEISLGDTTGMANPEQVKRVIDRVQREIDGSARLAVHFHDTRGLGLANAYAAYESGITIFDASIGGLGGCPFAPGATGNIATEDLAHMFELFGIDTGLDFDVLREANNYLSTLLGKKLPAYLGKTDPVWKFRKSLS